MVTTEAARAIRRAALIAYPAFQDHDWRWYRNAHRSPTVEEMVESITSNYEMLIADETLVAVGSGRFRVHRDGLGEIGIALELDEVWGDEEDGE